jgi:hypothetical protein
MKRSLLLFLFFLVSLSGYSQSMHLYQQRYTSTSFTVFNVNPSCYGGGLKMFINGTEHTDFNYGLCGGSICQFRFPFGYLKVGDQLKVRDACGNETPPITVTDDYVYVEVPAGSSHSGNGIGRDESGLMFTTLNQYKPVGKCEPVNINSHALHRIQILVGSSSSSYTTGIYKINGSPITAGTFDIDKLGIPSTTMTVNANGSITAQGNADLYSYASWSGRTPLSLEYTHTGQSDRNEFFVGPLSVQFHSNSSLTIKQFNYDGSEDQESISGDFTNSKFLFTFNEGTFKLFIDGVERKSINRTVIYSASSGSISNGGLLPYTTGVTWQPSASGNQWVQAIIDGIRVVRQNFYVAPDMVINETVTNVGCNGGNDGSITLNVSGGQGTLQYSKDNVSFSTNPTISGLTAGNHTVYVRDASGCSALKTITVAENAMMNVSGSITQNLSCFDGANGQVELSASGGAGFYQYSSDDVNYGNSNIISGLTAGTKTFYIRDAAGCKRTVALTINPLSSLAATAQITPVLCYGGATGSITINAAASAPSGGIQYALGSGAFQSSNSFNGITSGVYSVKVKDDICQITLNDLVVNEPSALQVTAGVNHHVLCYNGATGSVNVNASGGVAGYSYSTNAVTYVAAAAGINIDTLKMGNFKIWVKDANNCIAESNILSITQPALLQVAVDTSVNIKCYGESTGSVTLTATGGTTAYQYQLGGSTLQASATFGGLNAGAKSFTVRDANGCTANVATTLLQPQAALAVTLAASNNLVCNTDSSGRMEFAATGGTLPYQYSLNGSAYQSSTVFASLHAGNYTLSVRDGNSCPFTLSGLTLTQPTPIQITMLKKEDVNCLEYSRGEALVQASGSNGGFGYRLWGKDYQFNPIADISNSNGHFTNLKAGDYKVTATDQRGCQKDFTVAIISKSTNIDFDITKNLPSACDQNNGSIQVINTRGGRQPYSYSISTLQSIQNSPDFGNLYNGNYIVTVSDSLCSYKKEVDLRLPNSLNAGHTIHPISCNVADAHLEVNPISGGNGNYQLSLNGGTYGSGRTFTNLSPNVYAVHIKDQPQSCITVLSVEIKEQNRADIQVTATKNIDCFANATGSISVSGNNNMAPFTYAINNGGFNGGNTFGGLIAGTYVMRAMNRMGCQDSIRVTLTQPTLLESEVTKKDNLCFDDKTGELDVRAWGGVSPYRYTLNKTDYQKDAHFGKLKAGGYELTVRDDHECLVSKSVELIQPDKLELRPIYTDTVRCYGEKNGIVTIEARGGTPEYNFSKDSISFFGSPVFDQLAAGDYTFYITDKNQCANKADFTVTQPELLVLSLAQKSDPLCIGESSGTVRLHSTGGNGGNTYFRDNVFSQNELLFTGLSQGDYSFKVTDRRGCEDTVTLVKLLWPKALAAQLAVTQPVCFGDANATISLEVSGGVGSYGVRLADSTLAEFTGPSYNFRNLIAGTYEVLISDANGCHLGIPAQIADADRLFFDINLGGDLRSGDSVVVCQGQVVELNAQNPGMSINWYRNGTELPHYRNLNTVETDTVGIYTLQVRNPTGCMATDTFNLKNNQYALKADFLIPTQAFVGDTIVALDITKPIPDYTDWFLPPTARVMNIAKDKISFIPTTDGEYRVLMIAKSGECENFKVKNIEIFEKGKVDSTGQDYDYDNHDILEVIVFPNPSTGRFSVSISLNKLTSYNLKIYHSGTGELVYNLPFTPQNLKNDHSISLNLFSGVYIVKVETDSSSISKTLIIERY